MNPVGIVRKFVRWCARTLLVPVLVASTALGLTGGAHGTTSVTPSPGRILGELEAHHQLPVGTTLSFGERGKPTTLTLDDKGRIVVTPPRGESFSGIVARGFTELRSMFADAGVDVARAAPASAEQTPANAR